MADLEDSGQTKTNGIIISVTDQVSWVQVFEPDLEEEIRVVQEFDKRLKFVTFTILRDSTEQDINNNSPPPPYPPKKKDASDVLMNTNSTKFPCKIMESQG